MLIAIFSKAKTIGWVQQVCHQLWPQCHGNTSDSLSYNLYSHYFDFLWKFKTLIMNVMTSGWFVYGHIYECM